MNIIHTREGGKNEQLKTVIMLTKNNAQKSITTLLAGLYNQPYTLRIVLEKAGYDPGSFTIYDNANAAWFKVISTIWKGGGSGGGSLGSLLQCVSGEFPNNEQVKGTIAFMKAEFPEMMGTNGDSQKTVQTINVSGDYNQVFQNSNFDHHQGLESINTNIEAMLEEFENYINLNKKSSVNQDAKIVKIREYLAKIGSWIEDLGPDFDEDADQINKVCRDMKRGNVTYKEAIDTAKAYISLATEILEADKAVGGIDELKAEAIKAGSTVEDMRKYLKELVKRKDILKSTKEDLISTYETKAKISKGMAMRTLRNALKNL